MPWDNISMYPSIDNEVGLAACKEALDLREHISLSTECLLEAIKITLEGNDSVFSKNTASKIDIQQWVRSYADLAMTTIHRKILDINNRPNNVLFLPDW